MRRRSKSALFLMEQLIVIGVFAICASACVWILTTSYMTAKDSRDLSFAMLAAESAAETYKAAGGDIAKVSDILGGSVALVDDAETLYLFYNSDWHDCTSEDAVYMLRLAGTPADAESALLRIGMLSVLRISAGGDEILSFSLAARGQMNE